MWGFYLLFREEEDLILIHFYFVLAGSGEEQECLLVCIIGSSLILTSQSSIFILQYNSGDLILSSTYIEAFETCVANAARHACPLLAVSGWRLTYLFFLIRRSALYRDDLTHTQLECQMQEASAIPNNLSLCLCELIML